MNLELTIAQQIFAVFYAIFLGTMLSTVGARRTLPDLKENNKRDKDKKNIFIDKTDIKNASLNLFDTPDAWAIGLKLNNKPLWRFLLSIIVLNIIPVVVFAIVFFGLHDLPDKNLEWWSLLVIVWISLTPQYIYRFLYAILTLCPTKIYLNNTIEHENYADYDIAALAVLWEDRLQFIGHRKVINHIGFPVFFFLPLSMLFYNWLLVPQQINCFFIGGAWMLLGVGFLMFILNRFSK